MSGVVDTGYHGTHGPGILSLSERHARTDEIRIELFRSGGSLPGISSRRRSSGWRRLGETPMPGGLKNGFVTYE